jgi:hypothetical protein
MRRRVGHVIFYNGLEIVFSLDMFDWLEDVEEGNE